ncbi:MAG: DUF1223 domain-containing protein [Hyphomicrobium sp.]
MSISNAVSAETISTQPAVIELYTSQGCSSCPPADAVLGEFAEKDDVIALSLPVDYWDSLGWKDTFGSPLYSRRQRDYAIARGDGQVYTPQVVINGRAHVVGSSARAIEQGIAETTPGLLACATTVQQRLEGAGLVVDIGASPSSAPSACRAPARVFLAYVQSQGTVRIGRGENGGRTITYHNVVRALEPIGSWSGNALSIRKDLSQPALANANSIVVLVQQGQGGPLLGANRLKLRPPA